MGGFKETACAMSRSPNIMKERIEEKGFVAIPRNSIKRPSAFEDKRGFVRMENRCSRRKLSPRPTGFHTSNLQALS